ncbi:teneurin transmembrane protein [Aureococcus anophagefferens]|nr:teneurin transmembrane protein [Aureococcus anophagefferens]
MNSVFLALALGLAAPVAAECPNACSGHGTCGAFDECHCFPSWQEADCSGRTCPFALAHVDFPKGDLDGSADALSGRTTTVIEGNTVYPYGTTEQYPLMVDTFGRELINTAHAYAECGNKGLCDRKSGECECFPGYEGAGCQRASCGDPTCSGHGTCMSAKDLAKADHDNRYRLWDKDVSMGCKCEPGFTGPTCSAKMCKYGVDPLYYDDEMMSIRARRRRASSYGAPRRASAGCAEVVAALEELPNSVIPAYSVRCFDSFDYIGDEVRFDGEHTQNKGNMGFVIYDLLFEENLGDLKPIEINAYLDGTRPTLYVSSSNSSSKQDFDVDIVVYPNYHTASPASSAASATRTATRDNNVEVYNWDYGTHNTTYHPHIVKLAPHPSTGPFPGEDVFDAGKFHLMYFKTTSGGTTTVTQGNTTTVIEGSTDGKFYISGLPDLGKENRDYIIFATDGIATVIANGTEVPTVGRGYDWYRPKMSDVAHNPITAYFEKGADTVYTSQDVSCYSGATSRDPRVRGPEDLLNACLEKGDKVFLFNNQIATYKQAKASDWHPESGGNMYEIVKIGTNPTSSKTAEVEDRFYFVVDKVIKWDGSATQPRSGITTASADDDATTAYDDWTDDALRGVAE